MNEHDYNSVPRLSSLPVWIVSGIAMTLFWLVV